MFKRILVALKSEAGGMLALEKAILLAKEHKAQLHIFHAMDYRLKALNEKDPMLIEAANETRLSFESALKPILGDFRDVTFGCLPADPALEICKIARNDQVDLIILGSHQAMGKMCLGRLDYVGMTIFEKAPCPVMLVPLGA